MVAVFIFGSLVDLKMLCCFYFSCFVYFPIFPCKCYKIDVRVFKTLYTLRLPFSLVEFLDIRAKTH
jgi:hypothetical protein